ncbi:hypothetical protein PAN31108_01410 [Pandoraea anhela]|uniref:Uncharacterized protein n=1 Tax=Pandoraea anhela TaxID=2508295 RepID=A0A5E4TEV6_9BURK|nr:hypothetical protein PAN31108_01410 [Pandoraea anhela]
MKMNWMMRAGLISATSLVLLSQAAALHAAERPRPVVVMSADDSGGDILPWPTCCNEGSWCPDPTLPRCLRN